MICNYGLEDAPLLVGEVHGVDEEVYPLLANDYPLMNANLRPAVGAAGQAELFKNILKQPILILLTLICELMTLNEQI